MAAKLLISFIVGAVLMLLMSFTVYRKSYYYHKARAEEVGQAAKSATGSRVVTLLLLLAMVAMIVIADLWFAAEKQAGFGFFVVCNTLLVSSLSLFDAVVIDWLILAVWQPAFLLPEGLRPSREAMRRHIGRQLTFGWVFKLPMAFLAAGLAVFLQRW